MEPSANKETRLQRLTYSGYQIGDTLQQLQALLPRVHVIATAPDPPPSAVPMYQDSSPSAL